MLKILFYLALFLFPTIVLAAGPAFQDDIFGSLMYIISNWQTMGAMGAIIAIINIILKLLKSDWIPDAWFTNRNKAWKRSTIAVLGVALGIGSTIFTGGAMMPALFGGLFSSGGAMTIYHAFKDAFKK